MADEIAPNKLPARALLDTGVVMRALGEKKDDPRTPLCKAFWAAMLRARRDILIAAPTVSEISRNTEYPKITIPVVRNVLVVSFDQLAAETLAQNFPEQVLRQNANGLALNYMRYDALILACAVRYGATLVCLDAPLTKLAASRGVTCQKVEDFTGQLSMERLLTNIETMEEKRLPAVSAPPSPVPPPSTPSTEGDGPVRLLGSASGGGSET